MTYDEKIQLLLLSLEIKQPTKKEVDKLIKEAKKAISSSRS